MREQRRGISMSVRPFGLLLALATLTVAIGSPGCTTKTPEEARADLEKLKQKEKPKENFEALQAVTEPNELTFIKKDTKKDADQKKEDEILTRMIKPGHWTGVLVTTTANNFDFGGELSSEAHNSSQQPIDLEGSSFRLTTARPAALPKEQRKTLETIFFAPAAAGRTTSWMFNQLRNRQRGTEEYRGSELFQHMPSYQYFLFVLAKDATRYRYFKVLDSVRPPLEMPTVIVDDQNYYRVLTPRPEAPLALPTRALAWTNTAYFVWDDVLPEVLSPEQQQAMLDWLHWGGGLIISGPRTLDSLRGSFLEPYLPATGAQTASFDEKALAELNAHWSVGGTGAKGSALVAAEPWSGIKLEKHPEAEFVPGTGELVVERRVGRGRIVVTAFRLSERELIAWPSFDSFVNGCLLHRLPRRFSQATKQLDFLTRARQPVVDSFDAELVTGLRYFARDTKERPEDALPADAEVPAAILPLKARLANAPRPQPPGVNFSTNWEETDRLELMKAEPGVAGWNDFSPIADVARETLRDAAGISVPDRQFVVRMVGLYLLLVVPVNWLVFRALGRVEWAWIAVPVLAVAWGVVVVWLAQLNIGFARAETEVAVLEAQRGFSRGHLTRYIALYSSLSTTYDVRFDDPSAFAQPLALDRTAPARQGRSTVTLRSLGDQRLNNFVVASNSTGMVHSEQMIDLRGAFDWQDPSADEPGKLSNTTALKMSSALVIRRRADENGPAVNEAAWIGEVPSGASADVVFKSLDEASEEIAAALDGSPLTAEERPEGVLSLRRLVDVANNVKLLAPGDVRLVGTLDEGLPGAQASPAAAQVRRATLVVANLRFGERKAEPDENLRPVQGPTAEATP